MVVFVYTTGHAGPAVAGDPDHRPVDAGVQVAQQPCSVKKALRSPSKLTESVESPLSHAPAHVTSRAAAGCSVRRTRARRLLAL
jgi:hypothetical protein